MYKSCINCRFIHLNLIRWNCEYSKVTRIIARSSRMNCEEVACAKLLSLPLSIKLRLEY